MAVAAKIKAIAHHVPDTVLGNAELAQLYAGWTEDKIFEKTGIRERRIAAPGQTAGDLAIEAARSLFSQGSVSREDVDFLIFCTQAPDYILPTTACIIQDRLGLAKSIGALDINLGCSGFVYALSLAKGLIESGSARCVLILTADTYSKYIHPLDKSVRTLFGDAGAATAVVAEDRATPSIGPFVFGTDGGGAQHLIVEAGGFRVPRSEATAAEVEDSSGNIRSRENLFMNGAAIMTFSLKEVPRAAAELLEKAKLSRDEIDYYVLHQANKFMLDALRKKLGIPAEKMPICVEQYGNTVSSTIPIVLSEMRQAGQLTEGLKLMLIGFGVGLSWSACLINW
jgi:3-oxoacyl-[acyl-carrier-protein] synthase-3